MSTSLQADLFQFFGIYTMFYLFSKFIVGNAIFRSSQTSSAEKSIFDKLVVIFINIQFSSSGLVFSC